MENVVLTNMVMIYDNDKILVIDRVKKTWPGITFPGGHVEKGESFVESAIREVYEETGLTVSNLQICGIKQWTEPDDSHRYIVIFYKTNTYSGEIVSSDEGKAFWIKREELKNYKIADGFNGMLEVFENDTLSENFHYYKDGKWSYVNK